MSVKLADTLQSMNPSEFPVAMADGVNIVKEDGSEKSLQSMYEDGELGGGGEENIGKVVQIGFNGTLSGTKLTFTTTDEYEVKPNYEYEIDLHYSSTSPLSKSTEIEIVNEGVEISFVGVTHKDSSTNATVGELQQLMSYDSTIGYRWLFKAVCHKTSSNKIVFLIEPTIVNLANQNDTVLNAITSEEMLDAVSEVVPIYRGRQIEEGDLFICSDDVGYNIGSVYMWNGTDWTEKTSNTLEFTGTKAEWEALSTEEKAQYDGKKVNITDDVVGGLEKFKVVTMTYPTTSSTSTSVDLPSGFTLDNCMILGATAYIEGQSVALGVGQCSDNSPSRQLVYMMGEKLCIYVSGTIVSAYMGVTVKVLLYKIA